MIERRALVTGCAGFIGSHLTEALLAAGYAVLGVDVLSDSYSPALKRLNLQRMEDSNRFECVTLDLAQADLRPLVVECDVIFHLAAEAGIRESWGSRFESYVRNNILATQRLLESLREAPARRLVYASSSSIYGQAERLPTPEASTPRPFSPYGVSKLAAEHLCRLYSGNYGVETVSLRYFSVYGSRQRPDMAFHRFCRAAIEERPLTVLGDGTQSRDFTFVTDVVAATIAAAEQPAAAGRVYNIGGGSQIALADAIELLGAITGRELVVDYLKREGGDVNATAADITKATKELGYVPKVRFQDGLRTEFAWMCENWRALKAHT